MLDALPYETNFNPTAGCILGTEPACVTDPKFQVGFIKQADFAGVAPGGDFAKCNQLTYFDRDSDYTKATNTALPP